jgi:sugar/nucleoside kinase (ribokinase family)
MAGLIWGTLASMTPEDIGKVAASMSAMEIESVGVRIGMPKSDEELRSFMSYHPVEQASLQWSDRASRSASP